MTQASAPMSPAIKVITGLVLAMTAAMLVVGVKVCGLLWGGGLLGDDRSVLLPLCPHSL